MSYNAGIGGGLEKYGLTPREPHIVCDECGRTRSVYRGRSYQPAAWFLNGKAAPGWRGGRQKDGKRRDICRQCIESEVDNG